MSRPLPVPDRDSAPWWEALTHHRLEVQHCQTCSHLRWPARALCSQCGGLEWNWAPVSGRGSIVSWLVNRHDFGGLYPSPSTAVLVRIEEQHDILIPGAWDGAPDGSGLAIGLPVEVRFEDLDGPDGEKVTLLRWTPRA